jgi:hypothetical protein
MATTAETVPHALRIRFRVRIRITYVKPALSRTWRRGEGNIVIWPLPFVATHALSFWNALLQGIYDPRVVPCNMARKSRLV